MPLPADFRDRLLAALKERGAKSICEICGQNNWAVIDQAVSILITDLSGGFQLPPPQIPSGGLVCNNCGNIRLFALGALGLLPKADGEGKK
jgi:hypothetical protein